MLFSDTEDYRQRRYTNIKKLGDKWDREVETYKKKKE